MTAYLRRYYAGGGTTTTLSSSMSAGDTSFVVVNAAGWPGSPAANFIVVVDRGTTSEEKILCSSNTGTTVAVATRGYDGTSATTHSSAAAVSLCGGAIDFDEANQASNLLGNAAEGSIFYGKGAGTLSAKLAIGANGTFLYSNGTDPSWVPFNTAVAVSAGAATAPITTKTATITNNAASSVAITVATSGALDGQTLIVRFYDYSAVTQTLSWVNTENSVTAAPLVSNGSTTLPLTVGFIYNGVTSLWRCVGSV